MNRLSRRLSRGAFLALVALLVSACLVRAPAASYHALEAGLDSLRVAFNTDSGKVRAIFLASPT